MKPEGFDTASLKQAFGCFPSGVTVVTAARGETPIGFTASSFTSVSLTPPMLLFCIDKGSDNIETYQATPHFAINILSQDQRDISNRFAAEMDNRFDGINWQWSSLGNPLIEGCVSQFDCTTSQVIDAGDHLIIVGEIKALASNGGRSLGYYRGKYLDLNG